MWKRFAGGVAFTALAAAIVQPAMAQVTTSGIEGYVTLPDGTAAVGASVTVVDTRTGLTRTVTTSGSGAFDVRNLNVGGPYSVSIKSPGQQETRVEGISISLGQPTDINLKFQGAVTADTIVVTADQVNTAKVAVGPAAVFTLAQLENVPSVNRDIKDMIRLDPRIHLDYASGGGDNSNGIQCGGAHPRFNSLTVDGIRLSDDFGLNTNGYPTERIPFSYDSISQVAVELAPFDVQYGGFTACNINAVTKTATNKFHGGVFFDYTNDSLYGDKTDGIPRNLGSFDEKRYGVHLGGPIIADKLFFFTSYEKLQGANVFGKTPADVGLSDAAYQAVIDTAVNQYGYKAGGLPTSKAVTDEKFFARIDWNITDRQRAAFSYTYNDGFNFSPSDNSASQISDGNHYYEKGAKLNAYTGSLYSDWTDNFSTELRVSYLDLQNRQAPVAGTDFGEVQVNVLRDLPGFSGSTTVYLGADDSRHSNSLNYQELSIKAAASYSVGKHKLSGGFERQALDIYDLFIQQTHGEWHFSNNAAFMSGGFNFFDYSNSIGTNNPNDSAADFSYGINTLYGQDEWKITPELDFVLGLRYERYDSSDHPKFNAAFQTKYGLRNDENLDGKDILQPRVGITYDLRDNIKLRGGFGLFSGGNPNVWVTNDYNNNGSSVGDITCQNSTSATSRCSFPGFVTLANPLQPNLSDFTYPGTGKPFYEVPNEAVNYISSASAIGSVNALDPDFKIPASWKFALGTTIEIDTTIPFVGRDWTVNADFLASRAKDAAVVIPLGYTQSGRAADGRPIYTGNTADFLLTNSDRKPYSFVYSLSIAKQYKDLNLDWSLGYAYTDSKDTNPMTSSVAFSNFSNYTTRNPVDIPLATSDYEVAHQLTFQLNWEIPWKDRWESRVSLFGTANQGAPYSYTIGSSTFGNTSVIEGPFSNTRDLAYIPTGINDPKVTTTTTAGAQALQDLANFIDHHKILKNYKGGIAPRNVATDDWYAKFDLRLSQNFPGFLGTDKFQGFLVVENLGNLLNNKWGIQREHGFPGNAVLYGVSGIDAQGRYVISSFNKSADSDSIVVGASLWNVRVGLKYDF